MSDGELEDQRVSKGVRCELGDQMVSKGLDG